MSRSTLTPSKPMILRILSIFSFCFLSLCQSITLAQLHCATVETICYDTSLGFNFSQLPVSLQTEARDTLQNLLDHEGLYTLFSDLKPMSTGFWNTKFTEAEGEPEKIRDMKRILATFEIQGRVSAGVLTFHQSYDGTKYAEGYVANLPVLRRTLQQHANFFQSLGLDENSEPQKVIETVDRAEPVARFRGFGLLFGYPQHAVDFFVEAHQQQHASGKFVERDFFHVETYSQEKGAFVWAVPKGHIPNTKDLEIQHKAKTILERYRSLRKTWTEKSIPLESLIHHWFGQDSTLPRFATIPVKNSLSRPHLREFARGPIRFRTIVSIRKRLSSRH